MSYQRERDEFIAQLQRALPETPAHLVADFARKVLSKASTLERLACAQCNGDWPCDNGERKVLECKGCGGYVVRSNFAKCRALETPELMADAPKGYRVQFCQDCRTAQAVRDLCQPFGIVPNFGGDPRGYVVKLELPNGVSNTWGRDGYGVPTRSR